MLSERRQFKGFIADLGINVVCGRMDRGSSASMLAELQSPAPSKRQRDVLTELKSWSACSEQDFSCAETKQEFSLSRRPSLECVVCERDITRSPVYQCETGHLACELCSQRGNSCSSCSKAINHIKNVAIGEIIELLQVSCKFAKLGCKAMLAFTAPRSEHENICSFAPVNCPMPGCKQAGLKNVISEHLIGNHGVNSAVDIQIEGYDLKSSWHRAIFDLDSSSSLVLLVHKPAGEFYLLHQEHTPFGERLQVTSLADSPTKSCKRKYELTVDVDNDHTYSYKSVTTSNLEQHGGLLIPKMPGDASATKKRCNIRMLRRSEEHKNKIKL